MLLITLETFGLTNVVPFLLTIQVSGLAAENRLGTFGAPAVRPAQREGTASTFIPTRAASDMIRA